MKLYNISNLAELFHQFDACDSDVIVETADGKKYGWQEQKELVRSLAGSFGSSVLEQLDIQLRGQKDVNRMMSFLMECKRPCRRMTA